MNQPQKTETLRLAFYGRYSSDLQSDSSIEDQERRCRMWAERNGHIIVRTFEDRAVSGSSVANREGFQRLMRAAFDATREFNGIIVDDLSRLSRDLGDTHQYIKRLKFSQIRLISVVDGIDTSDRPAKVQVAVKALLNEVFLDNLKEQTKRGLDGRFMQGMSTGGKIYGYCSVPVDPMDRSSGSTREVNPEEAEVVREIFRRFVSGESEKVIAKGLNTRGVGGKKWSPNVLWHMLRNQTYSGVWIFNRLEWIKNPDTGRRIYRERPESEWIVRHMPELRIVDEETWEAAQQRIRLRERASKGRRGQPRRAHLLSGLIHCPCGRAMTIQDKTYACPEHFEKGLCDNDVRFFRVSLEALIIRALKERLVFAIDRLVEEANRALAGMDRRRELRQLRDEARQLGDEIANRVYNTAALGLSREMMARVQERMDGDEKRLREMHITIAELEKDHISVDVSRELVEAAVGRLDEVLAMDTQLAREFIAGVVSRIEITPIESPEGVDGATLRCPVCNLKMGKLTPQHAHKHNLTVNAMRNLYPEVGVNKPAQVSILPNIKNLLGEEVSYKLVAGAGFEPATFGL